MLHRALKPHMSTSRVDFAHGLPNRHHSNVQPNRGAQRSVCKLRVGRCLHSNDDAGLSQIHGMRASSAARASQTATCTNRMARLASGVSGLPLPPPMGRRSDLKDVPLSRAKHEKVPQSGAKNTK